MDITVYTLLLACALLLTAVIIWAASQGSIATAETGPRFGIVLSAAGVALWGVLAINSYDITVVSGGEEFTRQYEELAWLAIAGFGISLVSMFKAAVEEINRSGGV